MLGDTGYLFMALALAATLYGAGAALASILGGDRRWLDSARNALRGAAVLLSGAVVILALAFWMDDFGIGYVALHSARTQPVYLKLSAVWAGQEGSLLLWSAMQALFTAVALRDGDRHKQALLPWATVILALIGAFFAGVTLLLSNPFVQLPRVPLDGQGLNPVLRHPGMVFHPPTLYVGYVGLAVPFAFALASLVVKLSAAPSSDVDRAAAASWVRTVHGWLLLAWLGLSVGLFLGMRWAYDVLGWGGYWGWDPVENAGLMPWFTLTALLHGAVMQDEVGRHERGRTFRIWNYLLAVLSFVLVLFGTFATRSGLIQSVHAYAVSNLGGVFMSAILVCLVAGVGLTVVAFYREDRDLYRRAAPEQAREDPPLLSREGLFFLTLVLFLMLTVSVFVGTVLPTLTGWLLERRFEAGPAWFDRVTGPQFAALVLLLGICPLVGRSAWPEQTRPEQTRVLRAGQKQGAVSYVWLGLAGAGATAGLGALAGFGQPAALIGLALAGLAASAVIVATGEAAARRMRHRDEALPHALWALVRTQRRRYGGYLVHLGVILMAVGVIGTRMYQLDREVVLAPGEPVEVGRYTLVLDLLSQDRSEVRGDPRLSTWAEISVYTDRGYRATLLPQVDRYEGFSQPSSVTALRATVRDDLMVFLSGWSGDGMSVTLKVVVNALASFLWLGGLVFLAGGGLAFWPRSAKGAWNVLAPALLAAVLVGAAWAMWVTPHAVAHTRGLGGSGAETGARPESARAGRPRVGQPAPDFSLPLSGGGLGPNGSGTALHELRGEVVMLNFWAPWCPSCKEDLPMIEAVWREYRERGVRFVGVAFQTDDAAIAESVASYGLSYAIGLDPVGEIVALYGITGIPETFIIGPEGTVTFVKVGPVGENALRAALDAALGGE